MKHILAIDQGTTGSTVMLVDQNLNVVAEASQDFKQHFPKPGWVEHDLNDIWATVLSGIESVCKGRDPKSIEAIGITNQRETTCFWDKKTGEALTHAIVWQDRRTSDICEGLKQKGMEPFFQNATGLIIDPYFSGTKISWALKNWPEVAKAHSRGSLAAGTIDSYLLFKLTGGLVHATEPSNASRTLCFDIHKLKFTPELCSALSVPIEILPEVRPSSGTFGTTKGVRGLPDGIPISGILGDQQAALLGQACTKEGTAKCTYGTGAFVLLNTGSHALKSQHKLLTTVAWAMPEPVYALEGSSFIAGAAVQWFRDGLGLIKESADIEALASSVPSSDGVTFIPALTGLGAPYWNPEARGAFLGLTRGTTKAHMARALLEGIALMIGDLVGAMKKDLALANLKLAGLNVDGGASANNLLIQFQSDILGVKLRRPKLLETTSMGAVFAAGLGAGIWKDMNEIEKTWKLDREFTPQMSEQTRDKMKSDWAKAIDKI